MLLLLPLVVAWCKLPPSPPIHYNLRNRLQTQADCKEEFVVSHFIYESPMYSFLQQEIKFLKTESSCINRRIEIYLFIFNDPPASPSLQYGFTFTFYYYDGYHDLSKCEIDQGQKAKDQRPKDQRNEIGTGIRRNSVLQKCSRI
jgi:hypothetical protein